jgi:hypothetical protein
MATVVDQGPCRGLTAVPEHRLADELDLDATLEALDGADQHVVCVVVGRRARVRCDLVLVIPRPIVSAVRTRIQPVGVFQVVARTFVPDSYTRAVGWSMPKGAT